MNTKIMLRENIYWVGKIDDRDVPFHRLTLTKGTTYNSYLLQTEKPTIIDTVDISFGREYVENLKTLIDLNEIKYIVINHTEPDHSGALGSLAGRAKNAVIVCTEPAVIELKEMYKLHNREFLVVKDGDKLDIGGKTLEFYETPYLHTEETMVTYCKEDKVLFSCDIFSTHIANHDYFNDSAKEDIMEDFKIYYQLIMHPHRRYVKDMIKKIKDLDIEIIAPSHGYIIRRDARKFINVYDLMSQNTSDSKQALIIYSTMTGNTRKLASIIADNFNEYGLKTKVIDVNRTPKDEVLNAIEEADVLFFGSSTKYGDMVGNLEDILKELKFLNLENKICAAFGSYGWSGEAIEVIQDYLAETNIQVLNTSDVIKSTGVSDIHLPIRVRFSLQDDLINQVKRTCEFTSDLALKII